MPRSSRGGNDVRITKNGGDEKKATSLTASPQAMEHWALQYIKYVEVVSPESLRERIKETLRGGMEKYGR